MPETIDSWVHIKDSNGVIRIALNAESGDIRILSAESERVVHLDRTGGLILGGGSNEHGDVFIYNSSGTQTIHLDGEAGDLVLTNADAAEDFYVEDAARVEPGTVLVIDGEDRLRRSDFAYDTRVAGVVSGAASNKPAIVLGRQSDHAHRLPVALAGKVHVNADASQSPIAVGDLLTTSNIAGYAMRATEASRTPGAVIGKALAELPTGLGVVPILVALQ